MDILVINPGSTSTKVALYREENPVWGETLKHDAEQLAAFPSVASQLEMRLQLVRGCMERRGVDLRALAACVGRGGVLPPVSSGAYRVNARMLEILLVNPEIEHASNLGAPISDAIARQLCIPALIYDPVTVDEMIPLVRVTGHPGIERIGRGHNLNMRAVAQKHARAVGAAYGDMALIVAHIGGGITFSLHSGGRMIDMISDDEGSFSPERAGGLPAYALVREAIHSGRTAAEMTRMLQQKSGLFGLLGTTDLREVARRKEGGDARAQLVFDALALNIAKSIAKLAVVVDGKIDGILVTGGLAQSAELTADIARRVRFIAPVTVYPGENEMEALALGALRVLRGEETAREL